MNKKGGKTVKKPKTPVKTESDIEPSEEIDLDSVEGGKECAMCHDVPESIVYLSCDHIVCLVCVAKLLLGAQKEGGEVDFSEVQCGLCEQTTVLSKEVQETLLEFLNTAEMQENNESGSQESSRLRPEEDDEEDEDAEDQSREDLPNISEHSKPAPQKVSSKKKNPVEIFDRQNDDRTNPTDEDERHFAFMCEAHPGEEFVYYHGAKQKLLCAQCLLTEVNPMSLNEVRPIKKCLPEIMNDFHSLFSKAELKAQLLTNRKKDFEIRKEHVRKEAQDSIKRVELALDEIIDLAQTLKSKVRKTFEAKSEKLFEETHFGDEKIEESLAYFSGVVETIHSIKENAESPDEELFSFFFANQEKIKQALADDDFEAPETGLSKPFESTSSKSKEITSRIARETSKALIDRISLKFGTSTVPQPQILEPPVSFNPRRSLMAPEQAFEVPAQSLLARLRQMPGGNSEGDYLRGLDPSVFAKTNFGFGKSSNSRFRNLGAKEQVWGNSNVASVRQSFSTDVMHMKDVPASPGLSKATLIGAPNQYSLMKKREIEGKLRLFDLKSQEPNIINSYQNSLADHGLGAGRNKIHFGSSFVKKYNF